MMVKYTAAILLIAAALFWSSGSAKPQYIVTNYEALEENIVEENFRNKRHPDFLTDEELQEVKKGTRIAYADGLLSIAPEAHLETLREKLYKAAEKKYANFDDYEKEADRIYDEVTGINFDRIMRRKGAQIS